MDGNHDDLVDRVHGLSDLELAVLLSLVSRSHCVLGTPPHAVDDLVRELLLVAHNVFGLRCAVLDCHADTTLDALAAALLLPLATPAASPLVAPFVVARHLNHAPHAVQIQVLELLRTGRFSTPIAVHTVPRPFLLVAVVAAERGFLWEGSAGRDAEHSARGAAARRSPHMVAHLNDFFAMGHWHDPDDGFPNLEEEDDEEDDEDGEDGEDDGEQDREDAAAAGDSDSVVRRSSSASLSRRSTATRDSSRRRRRRSRSRLRSRSQSQSQSQSPPPPSVSGADIERLAAQSQAVRTDVDVLRYEMNVVAFLRMHRAVAVVGSAAGGFSCASPAATQHLQTLARCLAPLHGLAYVTPGLVALAARKTYLHRVRTVAVGRPGARPAVLHERSMQWGSEHAAVQALLEGVSPEDVIEDVLGSVAPPV